MQYEQNKINQMLPEGFKCYHSTEVIDTPKGNYLIITTEYTSTTPMFRLELWEDDDIFICTQLFEPPLHGRRTWKGPYYFCINMLFHHIDYLNDPERHGYIKSS